MSVNSISNAIPVQKAQNTELQKIEKEENLLKEQSPIDTVEFTNTKNELSKEDKQELVKKGKTTAAGWSCLFGAFSALYYGLRSDKKVAEKYNLDADQDKKLIKTIKREQLKATLPAVIGSCIFGVGTLVTGGISWLVNKNSDASKINVE